MQLARFPFTIVELPGTDVFDAGRVDERPTTAPRQGRLPQGARAPEGKVMTTFETPGPLELDLVVPAGEIELEAAETTTTEVVLEPLDDNDATRA